ncbi:hypothetical protein [Aureispira anguillae]|uniref:Alpha/beta hydrolase n=1 Tax=Aureispira anguillae TaxID=2864201 RepID=A0A915YHT5_9BACT|nr:hypothetical protein [Aureispira anguillae]BDS13264.1 hypothetical protein AsAng_0039940 [Aureispira anguillae]
MAIKPRLIILSDLWGREKATWVEYYTKSLQATFSIHYYDSCELAQVDKTVYASENLHQQFVNGGIKIAAQNLVQLETQNVFVLAFSVGGIIAWEAGLKGLNITYLYAISATRLRYQKQPLGKRARLYFGKKDPYKPSQQWFDQMNFKANILEYQGHELYRNQEFASNLCQQVQNDFTIIS